MPRTLLVCVAMFGALLGSPACLFAQPETAEQVLAQNILDPLQLRTRLMTFGDAAVRPIIVALKADRDLNAIQVAALMGVLQSVNNREAKNGLVDLLAHENPVIRATAALTLGSSNDQCMIPVLIPLLDDRATHAYVTRTHSSIEVPITINETVLEALHRLMKDEMPASMPQAEQRSSIENWWNRNRARLRCPS